jgi:hypothetical protein
VGGPGVAKGPEHDGLAPVPFLRQLVSLEGILNALRRLHGPRPAGIVVPATLGDNDQLVGVALLDHNLAGTRLCKQQLRPQ